MKKLFLLIFTLFQVLSLTATEKENDTKTYALIISVARYNHVKSLNFSDDDAYRFYAYIKSNNIPDEQVRIMMDEAANENKILKQLRKLQQVARPQDQVILFITGEGTQSGIWTGGGDEQLLTFSKIANQLLAVKAIHKTVILQVYTHDMYQTAITKAAFTRCKAQLYTYSKNGGYYENNDLRQGIFMHAIIKGLKGAADRNEDNIVTPRELADFTTINTKSWSDGFCIPIVSGITEEERPFVMQQN